MDAIEHKYVEVNGLKLHMAQIGSGSSAAVVFLHGFPEIWYSWRHQMIAVANSGYTAIAPDHRGYGLSDPSPEPDKTTFSDLVTDLLGILDALAISKVFLVAKDFGARPAYLFALLYPERVRGIISLGSAFNPERVKGGLLGQSILLRDLPEGLYIRRWQEPGRAEADFGRLDAKSVVRNIYILFSKSEIPIAGENQEIMDLVEPSTPLPSWFTEDDLTAYGALYEKSGFQTALKVPYRSIHEVLNIPSSKKLEAPTLLIIGEKDFGFKFPGSEEYVRSGQVNNFVPNLEIKYLPEGSHFVQEQMPDQVNKLILTFLSNNS